MIKISANISKKVPIPGKEFSSQQYGASMEIEISDADKPEAIQSRIHELYGLLSNSIDAQINNAATQQPPRLPAPQQQPQQQAPQNHNGNGNGGGYSGRNRISNNGAQYSNGNGNGNGRKVTCTDAQAKCIFAICKAQGLDLLSVLADFNVADVHDLHVRDASRLIDNLKKNQNSAA